MNESATHHHIEDDHVSITQEQQGGGDTVNDDHETFTGLDEIYQHQSMICMSVVEEGPRIVFAAYNEDTNTIIVEDCVTNAFEVVDIVERVLTIVRPNLILVSNKIVTNSNLLEIITTPPANPSEGLNNEDDDNNERLDDGNSSSPLAGSIPYRLLKTSAFDLKNCKTLILRKLVVTSTTRKAAHTNATGYGGDGSVRRSFPLAPPLAASHGYPISKYHALASLIDFDSNVQLRAIGSLLSFLQSTMFRLEEGGTMTFNDIIPAKASMYMNLPAPTIAALHIFATEQHPLRTSKRSNTNSKEGFSVFSLLDRTKSRIGRQRLREWMLRPLQDVSAISLRQDGVELFCRNDMQSSTGTMLTMMERIGAIDSILSRIQKCSSKPLDFVVLHRSLSAAISIAQIIHQDILWPLQQRVSEQQLVQQQHHNASHGVTGDEINEDLTDVGHLVSYVQSLFGSCNVDVLQKMLEHIETVIDEVATSELKTVVVRPGFNAYLDAHKNQYDQLDDVMNDTEQAIVQTFPNMRNVITISFMPQVGFLIIIENDRLRTAQVPDDFDFLFTESDLSFFKSTIVRQLDEEIGDLDGKIKDIETIIVADLEETILDHSTDLAAAFSIFAELDVIMALANCATDLKLVRPEVVPSDDKCIQILNGRHPLQEITVEGEFVPNDTLVDHDHRVNVITGPNYSGKSCYARQVGVIVYMAHIGCFVPCDAARISIIDSIYTKFSTIESCSVPQSSFQLDLSKMGHVLRRAGPNSLVIIDEFGKGTSPSSGIALLASALESLAERNAMVLCTTHFLELFSMKVLTDGENGITALRMTIRVPDNTDELAKPLFRLERGVASSSAGLICAKVAGLKESVVERAADIIAAVRSGEQVKPLREIYMNHLGFSDKQQCILARLALTDWKKADDNAIDEFMAALRDCYSDE